MKLRLTSARKGACVLERVPDTRAIFPTSGALIAGLFLLSGPLSLKAQEDAVEADKLLPEIIVTARRREENIQDVPLSITAFDALTIERRNIMELDDVARFTPGFAFEDFDGGNGGPVIRSQPTINVTSREQTTATFLDGVYLPRSWLVDLGATNLERIEIVKGPQSARYGRNAFAGAINYIPMKKYRHDRGGPDAGVRGRRDVELRRGRGHAAGRRPLPCASVLRPFRV